MKLSIIIPFYNASSYIERCIRSVCEQDIPLDTYEVIAVNDASTDDSLTLVRTLESEYSNLNIISLDENRKQGGARNEGLKHSKGDWIWFVDADDYILPNVLKEIVSSCKDNLDFVHFNYYERIENTLSPSVDYNISQNVISGEQCLCDLHHNWGYTCVNVWQRVMRKSFLTDNAITFVEGVLYEDVDYSLRCFLTAKAIRHINIHPYCYEIYQNSSSRGNVTYKTIIYWLELITRVDAIQKEYVICSSTKKILKDYNKYLVYKILENHSELVTEDKRMLKKSLSMATLFPVIKYLSLKKSKYYGIRFIVYES